MPTRLILACLLSLVMISFRSAWPRVAEDGAPQSFLYTAASQYEPLAWMHGAERFPAGAAIFVHDASGERALVPSFAASADPTISFDGRNVLFAGKVKPQDAWQIWEVSPNGGKPRHVSSASQDSIRPFYFPDDRVAYARKLAGRFVIEAASLDGSKPLALTYGPSNFLPTDVLPDGRILFEAGYPLGSEVLPEIYAVYSDGSGIESYRCDHGKARAQGRQVGGDIVFASGGGLARFTSARAQQIPIIAPRGEYAGDVAELATGDWLVSWRPNPKAFFQLMLWTPGAAKLRPLLSHHNASVVQPIPLRGRAVPKRHPSGLHDWPNANLLCLNAYTSKYQFAAGSIHSVRLYARDGEGNARLLGTAPVERDGSFFVQVPTELGLQIELLDASGKTLKRESGFFWMRRGEQRGCVGCHAGPETAPENAVPRILLKSTTPTAMTGSAAGGN